MGSACITALFGSGKTVRHLAERTVPKHCVAHINPPTLPGGTVADIISSVTTPLALLALFALIIGNGLYFVLRKKLTSGERTKFIYLTFASVLILSLLANSTSLIETYLGAEDQIRGEARGDNGQRLKFATIDVEGVGRFATADDGTFNILVPSSRRAGSYRLRVTAPGYAALAQEFASAEGFHTLTLAQVPLTSDNGIALKDHSMIASMLGQPLVYLNFELMNPGAETVLFEDIRLSVKRTSDPKAEHILYPSYGFPSPTMDPRYLKTPVAGIVPILEVRPQESQQQIYVFAESDDKFIGLTTRLARDHGVNAVSLCQMAPSLPEPLVADIESYFSNNFIWLPGTYSVSLTSRIKNSRLARSFTFEISESESTQLRNAAAHLKDCLGVNVMSTLFERAGARNYLVRAVD